MQYYPDSVDPTCQAGLYWEVFHGRLQQLWSLIFHWPQYQLRLFATPIVCHDLVMSAARVGHEKQQCCVAGPPEGSGTVVLELIGEHDRGSGEALVCWVGRHLVSAQHALRVYWAGWLGWVRYC